MAGVNILTNGLLLFEIPFELSKLVQSLFNVSKETFILIKLDMFCLFIRCEKWNREKIAN